MKRRSAYSFRGAAKRRRISARKRRPAYRRKQPRNGSRVNFNKRVLQVIKKTAEPKQIHNLITAIPNMYHNSFNKYSIYDRGAVETMWPDQGDGVNGRNGDEIYAKGFMIRGSMCFAGDRRGTTIRMYSVAPKDQDIALNYDNMFQNITDNVAVDPLDKRKFPSSKLLGTYKVPDRSAPTLSVDGNFELIDTNVIIKKWIPFDKKIIFMPGTKAPTNINSYLQLVFTAYDHNSASETDECIKSVDLMVTFYYADP